MPDRRSDPACHSRDRSRLAMSRECRDWWRARAPDRCRRDRRTSGCRCATRVSGHAGRSLAAPKCPAARHCCSGRGSAGFSARGCSRQTRGCWTGDRSRGNPQMRRVHQAFRCSSRMSARTSFRNTHARCGSSCAPTSENCTGTLGALVAFEGSREIYLLSNNHVFAGCNHVPKNQPILAPSSNDGRPDISAPREIGRHDRIHELRSGSPMFVDPCDTDLALARATNPDILCSWQGAIDHGYDTPDRTVDPASLMRVKQYGRTTGLSRGQIEAKITTPTPITYNSKHFKGVVWFKDIWTVRAAAGSPFALPGDSGSLVVTEDGSAAVGLLFAANPTGEYGWIIPISAVLATFGGLRLLHGHGIA